MVPGCWAVWVAGHTLLMQWAIERWESMPGFSVQDAYKFLYQATRGGEHAIANEKAARKWLDSEWDSLGEPMAGEALIEPLRPDGAVVRLNLRPFKKLGGDKERLFRAFVESANRFGSCSGSFDLAWMLFGERLKRGVVCGITRMEWERLDERARGMGYPAMHHSEAYEAKNRPAYRVIEGDMARRLVARLDKDG